MAVVEGKGVLVGMGVAVGGTGVNVGVAVGSMGLEVTVGGINLDVGVGWGVSHATKSNITNINTTIWGNKLL